MGIVDQRLERAHQFEVGRGILVEDGIDFIETEEDLGGAGVQELLTQSVFRIHLGTARALLGRTLSS